MSKDVKNLKSGRRTDIKTYQNQDPQEISAQKSTSTAPYLVSSGDGEGQELFHHLGHLSWTENTCLVGLAK